MVAVEWLDHYTCNPKWQQIEGGLPIPRHVCSSVGFIVSEDDTHIAIAQNKAGQVREEAEEGSNFMVILKSAIVKRKKLR